MAAAITVSQSFIHSVIHSFSYLVSHSVSHSVIQSVSQSGSQSGSQSVSQSVSQSMAEKCEWQTSIHHIVNNNSHLSDEVDLFLTLLFQVLPSQQLLN